MIDELDETIRELLKAELPIKNGEIEISFDQPKREWSARLTRPTVNFFLYDVRENVVLRHHGWETANGNGHNAVAGNDPMRYAQRKRTPFRADCYYMMTTWASEPDDEHRLLSRCLTALFRHPVLPEAKLQGSLKKQPFEIQARLASHDKLTNPAEVWSALDNELRPSVSYIVTIAIDPWAEISGPVVRTLTFRYGQALGLPYQQQLLPDGLMPEMIYIGGTVKARGEQSTAGIQVAVKGTGIFSTTDEQGRFRLGTLPPGEYTLVVWPAEGKPRERKVTVPAPDGDYDLSLG